jgi:hypothetical protein
MQCTPRKISQPIVERPPLSLEAEVMFLKFYICLHKHCQVMGDSSSTKGSIQYPVLGKTKILHCLLAA